ncbi:putative serine/threonine-protein phosphatase 6 regulatory ankyrin repeat subunit A-like [Azoarcus sp. CIB]|uniref:ankyrin repeat domain-containing protein n=1 Tax=Aromatoleum sp. (strain CIB) TaxID=198107 RepID=UPI0006A2A20E|nr:ankyrin repeat domain-containing protein [Azoarcus sp. CIB]AKU11333.1 putative serine/threonine-protein phosphatase 6 regulatory ankyrin repeat subunit A-like [Azoarcus sp. CIB]
MHDLCEAVRRGDINAVRSKLMAGADPDQCSWGDETSLMIAAKDGSTDIVICLLEAGAEFDFLDLNNKTALMHAVAAGHSDVVDVIINADSQFQDEARYISELLGIAASHGHAEMVDKFLRLGAEVDGAIDDAGNSALMVAARSNRGPVVRSLVRAGANVKRENSGGLSPLLIAVQHGDEDIVEFLIESSASSAQMSDLLLIAASRGHASIVRRLIVSGADINKVGDDKRSPLDIALDFAEYKTAKLLIDLGADDSKVDRRHRWFCAAAKSLRAGNDRALLRAIKKIRVSPQSIARRDTPAYYDCQSRHTQ